MTVVVYIYVYIYICTYICTHIYVHMYVVIAVRDAEKLRVNLVAVRGCGLVF